VWHEPEYTTLHHDAEYTTVHHDAEYTTVTEYFERCNDCGFLAQDKHSFCEHQDATGHMRHSGNIPVNTQVLVKAAWDERVLVKDGYWS
jgi:hypothetical protein